MRVLYLLKVDFVKSVECRNEAKKNILPINNVTLKIFMKFFFSVSSWIVIVSQCRDTGKSTKKGV